MTGDADETGARPSCQQKLAADWQTILHSEQAAWSGDREPAEIWAAWLALWAAGLRTAAAFLPPQPASHGGRTTGAGAEPAARPSSALAAPSDGERHEQGSADAARVELLARRVAELERRLAELGGSGSGGS